MDTSFVVDIYLNFRTGYLDEEGKLVLNRMKIALLYTRGWFVIDLISVLPFDMLIATETNSGASSLLQMSRYDSHTLQ